MHCVIPQKTNEQQISSNAIFEYQNIMSMYLIEGRLPCGSPPWSYIIANDLWGKEETQTLKNTLAQYMTSMLHLARMSLIIIRLICHYSYNNVRKDNGNMAWSWYVLILQ